MVLKIIAAFLLQTVLAARVQVVGQVADVCLVNCGATQAQMIYEGEQVIFALGGGSEINKVKYVPRADKCLSKCAVVESGNFTDKSKSFFGALKGAGQKLWEGDVKNIVGYSGTKSCAAAMEGSEKVSIGRTHDGKRVKLCCVSQDCPASEAPAMISQ